MQESVRRDLRAAALELQALLVDAEGVEPFLDALARWAADEVDGAQSCGVTVQLSPAAPLLGGSADEVARRMDSVQYSVDDGPCLTCLRRGVPVAVADVRADQRWPEFGKRGVQEGVGTSLSVPLTVRDRTVGALNLYGRAAHTFSEADHARAAELAGYTAATVALAAQRAELERRERHLETALSSRSTIDQAMGVLMAQARVTADEAFEILRQRSQHSNVKLREVAALVITEALRPA